MLPDRSRIRRRPEFAATVRRGRRGGARSLVVHLLTPAGPGAAAPRVGFVVGRTVGPAVVRNRVRRRLRELVRARLDRLPGDAMLVVRALPPAAGRSSTELADDLDRALARCLPSG